MLPYSKKVMQHFANPHNVGEIENADGVGTVGNPTCVIPQTLVFKNPKMEEISALVRGDLVLGHDGDYHAIEQVIERPYSGEVFEIRTESLGTTTLTPEHHIFALKLASFSHKYRASKAKNRFPDWFEAKELEKGDILVYPIPKNTKNVEELDFDIETPEYDFKSKPIPAKIKINAQFARLAGYYLAEGYARTQKCKGGIDFAFSSKEKTYLSDVSDLMNATFGIGVGKTTIKGNAAHIIFYSARVARFFEKTFGKGAENKRLPQWMLTLPLEKQRALLCGLWRGDGHLSRKSAKFVTISKQLAFAVRTLLMRLKIPFSFLTVNAQGIHKENYRIYVHNEDGMRKIAEITGIQTTPIARSKHPKRTWYDGDYFLAPISKIKKTKYSGNVLNLEVKDAHSFVTNSATLHNCGDIMSIYIKVKDNRIEDIKFKTFGCGAAIATSSMTTDLAKGKTLDEALKISRGDVAGALDGLPPVKMHCSNLAADALHAAIKDYREKQANTQKNRK